MFNDFQTSNRTRDADSLAEDSFQHKVAYQQLQNDQEANTANAYDFLIDDDYQHEQEKNYRIKWSLMGEKLALSFILREVVSGLSDQRDLLERQAQYHNAALSKYQHLRKHSQRGLKTQKDVILQIQHLLSSNSDLANKISENTSQLSHMYSKEQDKVAYLEQQLSSMQLQLSDREQRMISYETQQRSLSKKDKKGKDDHMMYIEEIEKQLQDTRSQLLDKKLKLQDKDEETTALKKQIQSMSINFQQLEEQKREIDELVIRVSQELKAKEHDIRDFNFQVYQDKEHMQKEVDILRRQLQEEQQRMAALEHVESDLILRLQSKEDQVYQLQSLQNELEEKLRLKSDAIEKAQKVIEKLNEEMERTVDMIERLEQERDQLRSENRELNKKTVELSKQLQVSFNQQQINHMQMGNQLKQEVDELKDALRSYQQEFENEKQKLHQQLRDVNEEKYDLHLEKERIEISLKKQVSNLQQEKDDAVQESQRRLSALEKENKEREEALKTLMESKDEQAHQQVRYLTKRLKEQGADSQVGQAPSRNQSKLSLSLVLRDEFDKVSKELLDLRINIRNQSLDQSCAVANHLRTFEDFRERVLSQFSEWEIKAQLLSDLSSKYEKELDEQKRMFVQMKNLLREKDQLIFNIQRLNKQKDSTKDNHMNSVKKELERQTLTLRKDILLDLHDVQSNCHEVSQDNQEMRQRFESFKHQYMQLLDEKDKERNQNLLLTGEVEILNRDFNSIKLEYGEFLERIRHIIRGKSSSTIENDLEALVDEVRVRRDEVISYKHQLQGLNQQAEQEKKFMQGRFKQVEEEIVSIQKQTLSKEEEQQLVYLQKETKLINEFQKLQTDLSQTNQQLQTRERQVKKLQEQVDEEAQKGDELKQQLEAQKEEFRKLLDEHNSTLKDIQEIQSSLDQTNQDLTSRSQQIEKLSEQVTKQEQRMKYLKDQLIQSEADHKRERDNNQQLIEEKISLVQQLKQAQEKGDVFERENQSIYKELLTQKDMAGDLSHMYKECEKEKMALLRECQQMSDLVRQAQDQMQSSQMAIDMLNAVIEKNKKKKLKYKEMKHQFRNLMHNQLQLNRVIEDLNAQLEPPRDSVAVQTCFNDLQEVHYYKEEAMMLHKQYLIVKQECDSFKDQTLRQAQDIDRIIEEKRDLEELVEQAHASIKQIRLGQGLPPNSALKENYSLMSNQQNNRQNSTELYSRILQEKENYIMRLEEENNDIRRESEQLKEKLISFEIRDISLDRSFGGNHQISALRQQKSLPFKGTATQNSINLGNLQFGVTPTTNFNTIQFPPQEETHKSVGRYFFQNHM